jgi:uncharacterized phage protein (TIGR02218 family)
MPLSVDSFTSFDYLTASQFAIAAREPRFSGSIGSMVTGWRGDGQAARNPDITREFEVGDDTFGVALHFRATAIGSLQGIFWLGNENHWHAMVGLRPTGQVFFQSTLVYSSKTVLSADTWYTIELLLKIGDNGGFGVWIDGVLEPRLARWGLQTYLVGQNVDRIRFYSTTADIDDLVIRRGSQPWASVDDMAEDRFSDAYGSPAISTLYAASDGAHADWTPPSGITDHSSVVDDTMPADDDTDYVSTSTENEREMFRLGEPVVDIEIVKAVTTLALVSRVGRGGQASINQFIRLAKEDHYHTDAPLQISGTPNWSYDARLWNTPPYPLATSPRPWALNDLLSMQVGVRADAIDSTAITATADPPSIRLGQFVAEVLHTLQSQLSLPVLAAGQSFASPMLSDPTSRVPRCLQSMQHDQLHRFVSLYRIERTDGTILRFTDHSTPLEIPAGAMGVDLIDTEYTPLGGVAASAREHQAGVKPSNLEIVGILSDDRITNEDLRRGRYRDAEITEFVVDWRYPWAGAFIWDRYWITETTFDGLSWQANVAGVARWLQDEVGRAITKRCMLKLGDSRCKFDLTGTPWTVSATVSAVDTDNPNKKFDADIVAQGGSAVRNFYKTGELTWDTGENAGLAFEVQANDDPTVWLFIKTPVDVAVGDEFTITAGCQKTYNRDCVGKFSNGVNFGGFPDVPGPDKVLQVPTPKS